MSSPAEAAVLIVDDDPDISRALTDFLEHEGYRLHLADTGAQALTQARQQRYDAVILDLGLPDRDGFEVLKVLLEIDPKLPVIVLTAFTTQDKAVGALSQGAFAFLTKPYNREQLKATLSQAIGAKTLVTRAETTQSTLIATEERLRSVMQSAIDAIIIADAQGRVLSWNKAAERIFGYGQQEMVGRNLTQIMPPRHREGHQQGLERLRAGGASKFVGQTLELDGLRKDGTEFPIELSLAAWTTGGETYYCGIIRDVTEKKRTERALRASEERFRSLVTNIPGVVYRCACDPDWTMEYINDAIEELCGYPASDFLANRVRSYASVIHPDDRTMVERVVFQAVKARQRYTLEYRVLHAARGVRWVYEKG